MSIIENLVKKLTFGISIFLIFLFPIHSFASGCTKVASASDTDLEKTITFRRGMIGENIIKFYTLLYDLELMPCKNIELADDDPTLSHYLIKQAVFPPKSYTSSADELFCKLNKNIRCKKDNNGHIKIGIYKKKHQFTVPSFEFRTNSRLMQIRLSQSDNQRDEVSLQQILIRENILDPEASTKEKNAVMRRVRVLNSNFERDYYIQNTGSDVTHRVISAPVISAETTLSLSASNWKTLSNNLKSSMPNALDNILIENRHTPAIETKQISLSADSREIFKSHWARIYHQLNITPDWKEKWKKSLAAYPSKSRAIIVDKFQENASECDEKEHGNHLKGIIDASPTYDIFEGIAYPVVSLKRFNLFQYGDADIVCPKNDKYNCNVVQFIEEQIDARVVNLSFHWPQSELKTNFGKRFDQLINTTRNKVYVIASGNDSAEIEMGDDIAKRIPLVFFKKDNVITVTALDDSERNLTINVGANRNSSNIENDDSLVIDLAAPGTNIPSICGGNIGLMSGSSQATAFVSAAASLLAREGINDGALTKLRILYTADINSKLYPNVRYGALNLKNALNHNVHKLCETDSDCKVIDDIYFGYKEGDQITRSKSITAINSFGIEKRINERALRRLVCNPASRHSNLQCSIAYLARIKDDNPLLGSKVNVLHNINELKDNNKNVSIFVAMDDSSEYTEYSLGEFKDIIRKLGDDRGDAQ